MNGQEDALDRLVKARQWKQAFNLCEKRIKKAPGSDFLLVFKIKILLSWAEPARLQQGIQELDNLIERKPSVTDLEALYEMDDLVTTFDEFLGVYGPKLNQIWQRAAASRSQDENFHIKWYQLKFNTGDFGGAQLVTISLFPLRHRKLT